MEAIRYPARWAAKAFAVLSAAFLCSMPLSGSAAAAGYPERPIELVVPWGPGGGADQLARLISKLMEPIIGQSIPVVNVPGGTGATGMAKLMSTPADGYSMAIYIAALDHEGHHARRGDDEGSVFHLREGRQQVQELG